MVNHFGITGLSRRQVEEARAAAGRNALSSRRESGFLTALKDLAKEPMFLLLLAASAIYFAVGEIEDALFMVGAIVLVAVISLYQDSRSRNALASLRALTQPKAKVIREGEMIEIDSEELVPGDCMVVDEGASVPADGIILRANDFFVNESLLTGESQAVGKSENSEDHTVYQGTAVTGGLAVCSVTATGDNTRLGQIGRQMEAIASEKTPLQRQIGRFVRNMAIAGTAVFFLVWGINYTQSRDVLDSLLKALTLAMSILPEEIPVAFTTFMALGAWRLMKTGVIVKQMRTVETLGSATVICTDKTGTITQNKMSLARLYIPDSRHIILAEDAEGDAARELIRMAMWSSEPIPFDPMETALHEAYAATAHTDERPHYRMIHEYPLSGRPPMMTHIFEDDAGNRIIACKGAPEAVIRVCDINEVEKTASAGAVSRLALEGYRVLAVGSSRFSGGEFPKHQQQFRFHFKGLVAFYDPPKENIAEVFQAFYQAGISVKILTGDNPETTSTIAAQTGFRGADHTLGGDQVMQMSDPELRSRVMDVNVFTRMFPEAKLRVIEALKACGQIVAMTGDGVNDGPALKAAHIGIAMGKKGTETARQAASLILMHDDLSSMTGAVAMGRKIYDNLKKAIQYIISIHIPIILTVFVPLAAGWAYPAIFTPVHVIFLELIMGPTCSIIYENEPMEPGTMRRSPRPFTNTFFQFRELVTSIIQGLVITAGTLFSYQYAVRTGHSEEVTRTMVFLTLISANIVLTLVNRSFYHSIFTTARYKNSLVPLIIGVTVLLTTLLLVTPFFRRIFQFEIISADLLGLSLLAGVVSVLWFEAAKALKRAKAGGRWFLF